MVCAKSQLADSLGLFQSVAFMMLAAAFFDESTDEMSGERCYTVAGFVGGLEGMLHLDFQWNDFVKRTGIEYFKSSECEYGFGQFAQFRDDPNDLSRPFSKREKALLIGIKTEAVDVIVARHDIWGIGTVLMLPDYARLRDENEHARKVLPKPYYLCCALTVLEAGQMMALSNGRSTPPNRGQLRPIFDSHEEYAGSFKEAFDSLCRRNPLSSQCLLPPHYENEQTYACLQAADLLAYESRRMLVRAEYETSRPENKAMARLASRVHKIYKLNYEALKMLAETQTSDNIPLKPAIENRMRLEF